MNKKPKSIAYIIYQSLYSFILAVSLLLLIVAFVSALKGDFIGWHISISILAFFLISLFFLYYYTENTENPKLSYVFLAFMVLYGVVFWKNIIGLWQSTPNEIQTVVIERSWGLVEIAFTTSITAIITVPLTIYLTKKYFANSKTK